MTFSDRIAKAQRRVAILATVVALAYGTLPMLGALHEARHFEDALAAAEPITEQIAASIDAHHDAVETCEICQVTARAKHTGSVDARPTAYVEDQSNGVALPRLVPTARVALSPFSARAPPSV
jgi:hypothetical protein